MEIHTIHHLADFLGPIRSWYEEHNPCYDPPRGAADRNNTSPLPAQSSSLSLLPFN